MAFDRIYPTITALSRLFSRQRSHRAGGDGGDDDGDDDDEADGADDEEGLLKQSETICEAAACAHFDIAHCNVSSPRVDQR